MLSPSEMTIPTLGIIVFDQLNSASNSWTPSEFDGRKVSVGENSSLTPGSSMPNVAGKTRAPQTACANADVAWKATTSASALAAARIGLEDKGVAFRI